jgi:hypothetical protein
LSPRQIANDGASHEWYTPPWVFERLGLEFDLDPASPPLGLDWVPAKNYYCKLEDGLAQPWYGRVWLNPPYGPNTKPWIEKMAEHGNGVALVFARTDVAWFHDNVPNATAICFLRKRLCFVSGEGIERQANSHNAAAP